MNRPAARSAALARRAVVGFLLRCLAYWGIALALVSRVPAVERGGVSLTVHTLQWILGLFHIAVSRVESSLFVANTSVQIVSDCSPHMPYLIYAAVVLAFPSSWQRRLAGLVVGAVVIHVFNTIRILVLIAILSMKREWFEFAHVYLWQTGTVAVVFATFALWLRSIPAQPKPVQAKPA